MYLKKFCCSKYVKWFEAKCLNVRLFYHNISQVENKTLLGIMSLSSNVGVMKDLEELSILSILWDITQ